MSGNNKRCREILADRQDWKCIYCKTKMAKDLAEAKRMLSPIKTTTGMRVIAATWLRVTFEHIDPASNGGAINLRNGVAACEFCNNFRRDHDFEVAKRMFAHMVKHGLHPHQVFKKTGIIMVPHKGIYDIVKLAEQERTNANHSQRKNTNGATLKKHQGRGAAKHNTNSGMRAPSP
ncbi:hypothetical protein [uncultured Paraglaciecola sp.]|uniref:HNH endonuclease n=1 Tax=uncultured Paraglaciecola sp. TaxID=1765024 RepID=UPI002629C2E7|nr:hypothetical protein [uncultured Paraglaciecola sp.]